MIIGSKKTMYNDSMKKATIKYLAGLKEIRFRVKPEEFEKMKVAAKEQGYASMRQFYLAAIEEKIKRGKVEDESIGNNN